jgi:hypothetical protein
MLSEIHQKYQLYKEIYEKELETIVEKTSNLEIVRSLLENSLYLSVFTIFESYLKELINNYNYNKAKQRC